MRNPSLADDAPLEEVPEPGASNVIDLSELLRQSLQGKGTSRKASKPTAKGRKTT